MSDQSNFPVEPWRVREPELRLDRLHRTESLFALSNGHIGVRGNLDEGEPAGMAGTYLNSFFESHQLAYAEKGYGFPESGQSVVNATNGKLIRLLVNDEPFDVRTGQLAQHDRTLDFRAGTLSRGVEWTSPAGQPVRVTSTRLVCFRQRAVMAIRYEVEAIERSTRIALQSELLANEPLPPTAENLDAAEAVRAPLQPEGQTGEGVRACLAHRTTRSGLRMAAAFDHVLVGDVDTHTELSLHEHQARLTVRADLEPGQRLIMIKLVAYAWSKDQSAAALSDEVDEALTTAREAGWDGLAADQRDYLDDFWSRADVEVDGDPAVQQAVRFGLFHLLQASARAEGRPIAAKGLTGTGYGGHAFWETEMFVLPVLTATVPEAAADALHWRCSTLPIAMDWARELRLRGAAFAWRTISGEECSGYWPAGTAAFHVNADIAAATVRHSRWTGDPAFDRQYALPILVETARLWHGLGYFGDDGRFHLDGVTGPDEYSALVDDNTYTNLMAAANLREAAAVSRRWPVESADRGVDAAEIDRWNAAADAMAVPYNTDGMPEQDRGSTRRAVWDFAASKARDAYPLHDNEPYFDIYRKQVAKQADLVLALHWCGEQFSLADKAAAFHYYEGITVRDSSLSATTQAVLAAEVGHLDLAHAYVREAALVDLQDRDDDTEDGLHMASLAGAWIALVCGFGGLRDHHDPSRDDDALLRFAPRLPDGIERLAFAVSWRDCCVHVEVAGDRVSYRVDGEEPLPIVHHGQTVTLTPGQPLELGVPALTPLTGPPTQPVGRGPEPLPAVADTALSSTLG